MLILAWVLAPCVPALAAEVLLLHSGTGPTPWNQRLTSGLIEGLGSAASVRQAFLKADGSDEDAYDAVYRRLSGALAGDAPEAVVAEGPVAFAFARKYADLFPGAPLIFCAMDRPASEILSRSGNCTGLSMTVPVRENIDLIFAMRPDTRLVVAIADRTPGSARLMDRVDQAMRPYLHRAQIMFPGFEAGDDQGLDLHALGDTLASVPSTGAVLFLRFSEDREGTPVPDETLAALIRDRAASPVFLAGDAVFGSGAVGGWMIPAKDMGADAARVVLKALDGEKVSEMLARPTRPVLRFDGTALARYGLKAPDKAELVNPPAGKVEERPILPVTGLAWALGLAATAALAAFLRGRYKA
ncbi:hypothetical protein BerOc1_01701 [Pseudodesulfovibrio hydrargyri]|uniref:ABC transporter substrate binding protein n=2 Tax=Pseudodesulfovibrio hydrargyri TaxID=2125990 RepID=A0A1J5N4K6_9BACT|nr:hypothetical protein BerOc1_01701 [Pseudodesulfovibrio hydrargyri]